MLCYECYANDPARIVELWARSKTRVVLATNILKHLRARERGERASRRAKRARSARKSFFPHPHPFALAVSEQS